MFAGYSDFLKVVMYHNCGGPRMARYIHNINATLFADLTPEQTTEFTYRIQQYASRRRSTSCRPPGLSADYVMRETRRAVAGAGGKIEDLAGHRNRHPDRREGEEVDAGGCLSGGQSRGPGRRGRHSALAEVLGDAARQPARGGPRRARSGASVVKVHLSG